MKLCVQLVRQIEHDEALGIGHSDISQQLAGGGEPLAQAMLRSALPVTNFSVSHCQPV